MSFLYEHLTSEIINKAIKVHTELGPGLMESAYEACLYYELKKEGFFIERQVEMPIKYDGLDIDTGYRLDLIVEKKVIIEIKAVRKLSEIHTAQLMTYLKLSQSKVGLLINFNVSRLKNGIKRVVL